MKVVDGEIHVQAVSSKLTLAEIIQFCPGRIKDDRSQLFIVLQAIFLFSVVYLMSRFYTQFVDFTKRAFLIWVSRCGTSFLVPPLIAFLVSRTCRRWKTFSPVWSRTRTRRPFTLHTLTMRGTTALQPWSNGGCMDRWILFLHKSYLPNN